MKLQQYFLLASHRQPRNIHEYVGDVVRPENFQVFLLFSFTFLNNKP